MHVLIEMRQLSSVIRRAQQGQLLVVLVVTAERSLRAAHRHVTRLRKQFKEVNLLDEFVLAKWRAHVEEVDLTSQGVALVLISERATNIHEINLLGQILALAVVVNGWADLEPVNFFHIFVTFRWV